MLILCVIGKSGSGKSAFCEFLKQKGLYLIDADQISRKIVAHGSLALEEIRKTFGEEYFENGNLLRKKLGKLVFSDKDSLEKLNSITSQRIYLEILKEIENNKEKDMVIDAFSLPDDIIALCDKTILVEASDDIRIKRIMFRDGLSEKEAKDRLLSQETSQYKADFTIDNSKSKEEFLKLSEEIYEKIRNDG